MGERKRKMKGRGRKGKEKIEEKVSRVLPSFTLFNSSSPFPPQQAEVCIQQHPCYTIYLQTISNSFDTPLTISLNINLSSLREARQI